MRTTAILLIAILMATSTASAQSRRDDKRSLVDHCRAEVRKAHPEGTLSLRQKQRQRLVDTCVANGGHYRR